jgi:hypothetical protein
MPNDYDTTVVSLDKYSWEYLKKNKIYIFPQNSRKINKYFAFYEGEPVSAITSYAEVKESRLVEKKDIDTKYWMMALGSKSPPYELVKFDSVKKFENPIKKDGKRGIQGRVYTSLKKLLSSNKISEIY